MTKILRRLSSERTLLGLAALLAIALLLSVRVTARALGAVYYIPSAERLTVGRAEAGKIPESHVAHFARAFVTSLENYTPATVEEQLSFVRGLLSPAVLAEQEGTFHEIALYSTRGQISSHLVLNPGSIQVAEGRDAWEVTLEGAKTLYTRGRPFRSSRVRYAVSVVPGVVTRAAPDGLWIAALRTETLEETNHEDRQ